MKFKIRELAPQEPAEPELQLWLERDGKGNVDLKGSLPNGESWFLICLRTDGTMTRISVPQELGFQRTDTQRIVDRDAGK